MFKSPSLPPPITHYLFATISKQFIPEEVGILLT